MIDDQMTPEERHLILQIQAASKPKLDATAREVIRQDMLSEFRVVISPGQSYSGIVRAHFSIRVAAILVTAVAVVVVVGLIILQNGNPNHIAPGGNSILTASPENLIAAAATQTSTFPVVAATPSAFMTPSPLVSPESIPSSTLMTQPTAQITPFGTPITLPSPTEERIITIEGPVTSISDNAVTIYGFRIEVTPSTRFFKSLMWGMWFEYKVCWTAAARCSPMW